VAPARPRPPPPTPGGRPPPPPPSTATLARGATFTGYPWVAFAHASCSTAYATMRSSKGPWPSVRCSSRSCLTMCCCLLFRAASHLSCGTHTSFQPCGCAHPHPHPHPQHTQPPPSHTHAQQQSVGANTWHTNIAISSRVGHQVAARSTSGYGARATRGGQPAHPRRDFLVLFCQCGAEAQRLRRQRLQHR
jgi:hypothetical protein